MTQQQAPVVGEPRSHRLDEVKVSADIAGGLVIDSASGPFTFRVARVDVEWSRENMGPWRFMCTITGPRILKGGREAEIQRGEVAWNRKAEVPDWLQAFLADSHPDKIYGTDAHNHDR